MARSQDEIRHGRSEDGTATGNNMDASHRCNVESKNQLQKSTHCVIFIQSVRTGKLGTGDIRQNSDSPGKGGDGK